MLERWEKTEHPSGNGCSFFQKGVKIMNFKEYKQIIKGVPYTEELKFSYAVMWLHPEILPLKVVSVGENPEGIIRIPEETVNSYKRKVPVVAIDRGVFVNRDKVTDIILHSGIKNIPQGAFAGCSALKRITIPKKVKSIREGTFAGCDSLEDVYYEGTMKEWKKVDIVRYRHEIELGGLIPGTASQEVEDESLTHIPGNDALLTANIHFNCDLPKPDSDPVFKVTAGGKDITNMFRMT